MADDTTTTTAAAAVTAETAAPVVGGVRRRGLVAGAAAMVAGLLAVRAAAPVAALDPNDVVLGASNSTTGTTSITSTATVAVRITSTLGNGIALIGNCTAGGNGLGVLGQGTAYGVFGEQLSNGIVGGAGVYGKTNRADSYGVHAHNNSGSGSVALYANIVGSPAGYAAIATTQGEGSVGVYGSSTRYTGVYGSSGSQTGTLGVSQNGNGVYGVSTGTNVAGVYGTATAAGSNSYGSAGVAGASGTGAGKGLVLVQGNHVVTGTKSAAVPHPDGSLRLLYCVEAPEAWFEDFGEGKLAAGRAEMRLDADFLAVVDASTMHVFTESHSDEHHLSVTARTSGGFTVAAGLTATAAARGRRMEQANGTFSYRVVAKRKDVRAGRLAKFVPPPANARPTPLVAEPPTPPPATDKEGR